jgi:VIT1/CCC1 family predicted Fe2+/Mn2+ transporter
MINVSAEQQWDSKRLGLFILLHSNIVEATSFVNTLHSRIAAFLRLQMLERIVVQLELTDGLIGNNLLQTTNPCHPQRPATDKKQASGNSAGSE